MFPIRERRRSATARQSHSNSLRNTDFGPTAYNQKPLGKGTNFLESLKNEQSRGNRENTLINKPYFRFADNTESQEKVA